MVMENQSFSTTIYVNCEVYNSSMDLAYWIYDSSNYTVYSGNQSWTSMNNYSNFNWSVPGLSIGNYTFHAQLYVAGSYHDSSSRGIVVYTNSSGGGGNNSGNQTSPCGYNPQLRICIRIFAIHDYGESILHDLDLRELRNLQFKHVARLLDSTMHTITLFTLETSRGQAAQATTQTSTGLWEVLA